MSSLTTTISSGVMEESQEVDTRLSLVIGTGSRPPPPMPVLLLVPSPENEAAGRRKRKGPDNVRGGTTATSRQHSKRSKTLHGGSDVEDQVGDEFRGGARKKLRLSEEQVALLKESFRAHNVLSHGEKHDMARELGLKPRQVEVWFQNRRARTKLKQTEIDFELLRRWCERLSDDNVRLQSELAEARTLLIFGRAQGSGLNTLSDNTGCPSCNRIAGGQTVA